MCFMCGNLRLFKEPRLPQAHAHALRSTMPMQAMRLSILRQRIPTTCMSNPVGHADGGDCSFSFSTMSLEFL